MSAWLRFTLQTTALAFIAALLLLAGLFAHDLISRSPCRDSTYAVFLVAAIPSFYLQLFLSSWLTHIILFWSKVKASLYIALAIQVALVIGTVIYATWPALTTPPVVCE